MKKFNYLSLFTMLLVILFIGTVAWTVVDNDSSDVTGSSLYEEEYYSPTAVIADSEGENIFIGQKTANKVTIFNNEDQEVVGEFSLPDKVRGLEISSDDNYLYVTTGTDDGQIYIIDLAHEEIIENIAMGHTPVSPVLMPGEDKLYVLNRFSNTVSLIDLKEKSEIAEIDVLREPVDASLSVDGNYLFVANHLPVEPAISDFVGAEVSVIDTRTNEIVKNIKLSNGTSGVKGMTISPDGKYIYITHILGRYQYPVTQMDRGWVNTNALSIIDVKDQSLINTVLLDDVDNGAANPWGVECTEDGKFIIVSHAGTHELSIINRVGLHNRLLEVEHGEYYSPIKSTPDTPHTYPGVVLPEDVPNDISFMKDLRARLSLKGIGPRDIAVVGTTVFVGEYFSDSLGIVDIEAYKNFFPEVEITDYDDQLTEGDLLVFAENGKEKAESEYEELDNYNIFLDKEALTLFREGDWEAAGYEEIEDAITALFKYMYLHDIFNGGFGDQVADLVDKFHSTPLSDEAGFTPLDELYYEEPWEFIEDPEIEVKSVLLGPDQQMDMVRKGEMLFNDASYVYQQWQSCASCHPDARVDGFNWDQLNDGIGNPTSTRSLVLSHDTPPVMITGIRPNAETAVRAGIMFIGYATVPEENEIAIDEYLKAQEPVPSPYLENGELTDAAERGKDLFNEVGCIECHSGSYFTNGEIYNVGTESKFVEHTDFVVPTLLEVWRTKPFLHDGRTHDIMDVFEEHGIIQERVSDLNEEEMNDLAEYVLSL